MTMLQPGDEAPQFSLLNQTNDRIQLSDFRGKRVVLYFYPKALTPGCVTQACGMRDIQSDLAQNNTITLAISPDPVAKLAKFTEKHQLNFHLLSDEHREVSEAYGVWQLKKFMGREYMGVVRTTFIISPEGRVEFATDNVKTKTHHQDVIAWLQPLS